MDYQYIFERVESKYVITRQQRDVILNCIKDHIAPDIYPHSDITSIYFDSDDFRLIRNSLEKPAYREKLRLRCYGQIDDQSSVFFEIKKKYNGVIYKRRQDMTYKDARNYLIYNRVPCETQIMKEIDYLRNSKDELKPKCLISYQRDSYAGLAEADLRITFDYNVRYSTDNLVLTNHNLKDLTDEDMIIMEIKTLNSMPLWLTEVLDKMNIYPSNFSKYGTVYCKYLWKGATTCSTTYSHQYTPIPSVLQTTSFAQSLHSY